MVRAKSIYTREHMKAFDRKYKLKKRRMAMAFEVINILFLAIFIIYLLNAINEAYSIMKKHNSYYEMLIFPIAVFLFALIVEYKSIRALAKKMGPIEYESDDMTRYFDFEDNEMIMRVKGNDLRSLTRLKYEGLGKSWEIDDFFFIACYRGICIIRKTDITEGSSEELRAFLTSKLGERFRVKP